MACMAGNLKGKGRDWRKCACKNSRLFSIQGASHTSSVEGRIVTELPELPSSTTVSTVQWSCNQHLRVCSSQMGKYSLDTVY